MCLFPRRIPDPSRKTYANLSRDEKYELYTTHGIETDPTPRFVYVPCGQCYDCLKKAARQWRFRLFQEMKLHNYRSPLFLTLTLDVNHWEKNPRHPREYLRAFFERFRYKYGYMPRHFFVHEYGTSETGTHRLHFHGIIFDWPGIDLTTLPQGIHYKHLRQASCRRIAEKFVRPLWTNGIVYLGDHCGLDTAIYIVKYLTKGKYEYLKEKSYWQHPPRVYCSPGIGRIFESEANLSAETFFEGTPRYNIGHVSYVLPLYYKSHFIDTPWLKYLLQVNSKHPPSQSLDEYYDRLYQNSSSFSQGVSKVSFLDSCDKRRDFYKTMGLDGFILEKRRTENRIRRKAEVSRICDQIAQQFFSCPSTHPSLHLV